MTRPVLGFGTGSVLGRHGAARSRAAIAEALALGVRHFDTARSYGWGEAEALLGQAVRGIPRSELTLVSKCGIVPVRRTRLLGLAKASARRVMKLAPGLRGAMRSVASSQFQPTRTYDVAQLDASLRTSLAELGTDYLDVLLLHNFETGREGIEPVVDWMRAQVREGRIRRHGFAIGLDALAAFEWLEARGLLEDAVIQAPLGPELLALPERFARQPLFVHSVFRSHDSGEAEAGQDLRSIADRLAAVADCQAIVCSMFSPAHIRANAAALEAR